MGRIIKLMAILVVLLCIGTASAEAQTGSITVYLENAEGTLAIYQTDNYREEEPDELAALIRSHNIQGRTKTIVAGEAAVFEDLPQGRYLVTHQGEAFRPFLATIPITINGTTSFAVEARPKTQDSQTPQTGDSRDLRFLCTTLFVSLIGIAGMTWMCLTTRESSAGGKMFLERVQNKQKWLR